MDTKVFVSFPQISPAEASLLAIDLAGYLNRNVEESVEIVKERDDTMDFGATLVIILGTGSAIALAKGIANWLQRQQSREILIRNGEKEISGKNLSTTDIKNILEKVNQV